MAKNGLLIDYDYCTGCHTCEVACQQEHSYPAGEFGIKVTEYILETFEEKPSIFISPFQQHSVISVLKGSKTVKTPLV